MQTVVFALLLAGTLALRAFGHGGGLNKCCCHFNRKTGECHCHRPRGCGCACEPPFCAGQRGGEALRRDQEAARGQEAEPALDQELPGDVEPVAGSFAVAAQGRSRGAEARATRVYSEMVRGPRPLGESPGRQS
jgi:hypothetical protein